MPNQLRPTHRNTQQADQRGNNFRQGNGSRLHQHRLNHGFSSKQEWQQSHHSDGGQGEGSQFIRPHSQPEADDIRSHYGLGPKNYKRTDERIYEEICDLLMADHNIDASEIIVDVKDGNVALLGYVSDRSMKWEAEDLAIAVNGVKDVQCDLKVHRHAKGDSANQKR